MRQIRIARRRQRPADRQETPAPLDPADPDIVHVHQAARRAARSLAGREQPGASAEPAPGDG